MSEVSRPLPYEPLAELLAKEAEQRLIKSSRTPRFREFLHELLHDTLEIGMALGEHSPHELFDAYQAGYADGKMSMRDE